MFPGAIALKRFNQPVLHHIPGQLPRHLPQQAQAHWLLAIDPLPAIDRAYPVVWEQILNERLSGLPVAQR